MVAHTTRRQGTKSKLDSSETLARLSNRLVTEQIAIDALRLPARKVKPASPEAIALAQGMLQRYGQPIPVLADGNGVVIAGVEIYAAAKALGFATLQLIRLAELSETDRRILTLMLARLPEKSEWDDVALAAELSEIMELVPDDDVLGLTGFSEGELDVLIDSGQRQTKNDTADEVPNPPAEGEALSQKGDLWLLDGHRLLCGDSRAASVTTELMAGESAAMILTDPPYNIKIDGHASKSHGDFQMASGEMDKSEFTRFLRDTLGHAVCHLLDGGLTYVFMGRLQLSELLTAAEQLGLSQLDMCIWNKGTGGMGPFYRTQHEPCLVFKWGSSAHLNNVQMGRHGRYRTNVWDYRGNSSLGKGRQEALTAHPTVKPVALLAEAMKDCTRRGDIVLDPFAGSGSAFLAAERTGRRAFGIEIEPRFVDVALARWQKVTGKVATLAATGDSFAEVLAKRRKMASCTRSDAA